MALWRRNKIDTLNKQLYARDESADMQARTQGLQEIGIRRENIPTSAEMPPAEPVIFTSMKAKQARRRRRMIFSLSAAVVLAVIIIVATLAVIWYRGRQTVTDTQMVLTITAPGEFTAGNENTYTITYANKSFVDWQNVAIIFEAPRGFQFVKSSPTLQQNNKEYVLALGKLAAGQGGQMQITGTLIGEQNAAIAGKVRLDFTPVNYPSGHFTKSAVVTTTITSVPIEVSMDAAITAESGEHVVATVQIRNTSSHPIPGAYVHLKPAAGMQLAVNDPQVSTGFSTIDGGWDLGTLNPLEVVQRTLVMVPEGQPAERRTLDVEVGIKDGQEEFIQRVFTHVITLTASELTVDQKYNGEAGPLIVKPGDTIHGQVHYANVGTTGLKNAVVSVKFEGEGFDPASLKIPQGGYDPTTQTITWTAASIPELATLQPQQSGDISYDFSIAPVANFKAANSQGDLKNYTLTAKATIDSPDLFTPSGQPRKVIADQVLFSIGTNLVLQSEAFYDDGRLGLTSTGPLPPKVGQQTTYTIRLRLGSELNDVGDVRVVAVLPDGVKYTNKTYLTTGTVEFNDRTGAVTWTIPQLPGGAGRLSPPAELNLQVAIVPGENQVSQTINLLNKGQAQGMDLFTNDDVTTQLDAYPTTETASPHNGKVVP